MINLWCVFVLCIFPNAVISVMDETVNTTSGIFRGSRTETFNVIKFLGIPYAEPPIGERRFKPPVEKTRISEILNATTKGFICPQLSSPLTGGMSGQMNEDCLNLNIFAPLTASAGELLSVMVWVHGGGYSLGTGSSYDATLLAGVNNVVVVTINYRLGILGFLNTRDDNSVGNFGLRDQCLALKWVNENIESFGGNSSSITIFGESAGAGSVTQLTMAASCEGLFHRVIAQSGNPLASWANNPDPVKTAKELGNKVGCPTETTSSLVRCLRGKTTDELVEHQKVEYGILDGEIWVPSYTRDFFSFVPKELPFWVGVPIKNKMSAFDLMIGVNMEESEMFYEIMMAPLRENEKVNDKTDGLPDLYFDQALMQVANATIPGNIDKAKKLLPSLRFQYTDWENSQSNFSNSKMLIELMGDRSFHVSAVQYARMHAEFGHSEATDVSRSGRTYFYILKHRPSWMTSNPWTVGATHMDEISFIFGLPLTGFIDSTPEESDLSRVMMEYWTNFAKTGDPNRPNTNHFITDWPTYSLEAEEYIELDVNMTRGSTNNQPYARRVAFWDEFIPEQVKLLQNEAERKSCDTDASSLAGKFFAHSFTTLTLLFCGHFTVDTALKV